METTTKKILIVEDDQPLREAMVDKFKRSGFVVTIAKDGVEGLEKLASDKPDIALLDIMMPRLDGFAVLEKAKQNDATKNIPIILVTNLSQDEDMERGSKLGAAGYLVKSNMKLEEIVEKVKSLLPK